MKKKLFLFLIIGLAFSLLGLHTAQALTFDLNYEYSGATPPQGPVLPLPWLRAIFTDDMSGGVDLKLEALGLVDDEFVSNWLFNIDPDYEIYLPSLKFSPTGSGSFLGSVGQTADTYGGGGAHGFDIQIGFPTAKKDRFGAGDSLTFSITSTEPTFTPSAELFNEVNDYKNPPFFETVAHIQGIAPGGEESGWIAPNPNPVPEPATMLLVGVGLIGLAGFGRRRFKA